METGFIYDTQQGAFVQKIGKYTLIQRRNENQVAAFRDGKCVATFDNRTDAKGYAHHDHN